MQKEGLVHKKAEKKYMQGFKMTEEERIKLECHRILNKFKPSEVLKPVDSRDSNYDDIDASFEDMDFKPIQSNNNSLKIEID
jgi:hypothetical protein